MTSLLIRGGSVVRAAGDERVDLLVEDGVIRDVHVRTAAPPKLLSADNTIDAAGQFIFPGFVDCHVHFREPGMEQKGTMESEAQSACAGGITTVCDMPNTRPPTVTVSALREKVRGAEKIDVCDIRFFFGVTKPEHLTELKNLQKDPSEEAGMLRARCCGVKLFFDHSTGDQKAATKTIRETFQVCAELKIPVVAHCEDAGINAKAAKAIAAGDASAHSLRRPPEAEKKAIASAIELSSTFGTQLHIAHLSTAQGLLLIRQAKEQSLPITCEVTPHHLFLSTEDYPALGTFGKMNPPLRSPEHLEALWGGLEDGVIDCIASDHAPHTSEEKRSGNPLDAPSGVPGVETLIPLLLTVAAGKWPHPVAQSLSKKFRYADIGRLCFKNPNRIFALGKRGIEVGAPADLVLVHPEEMWTLKGEELHAKCKWTPYEGWNVTGKATVVGRW
ncbi:MAG: dihydroorotase family protein [Candidatus Peribacteraceae bacterium]|nr:dihydroorotase family protein [Candidatus Peribacteraceae bacterium]MDD5074971.1 dihydroorotase family protein [Candidatus Peribacteraceae bacterium]